MKALLIAPALGLLMMTSVEAQTYYPQPPGAYYARIPMQGQPVLSYPFVPQRGFRAVGRQARGINFGVPVTRGRIPMQGEPVIYRQPLRPNMRR